MSLQLSNGSITTDDKVMMNTIIELLRGCDGETLLEVLKHSGWDDWAFTQLLKNFGSSIKLTDNDEYVQEGIKKLATNLWTDNRESRIDTDEINTRIGHARLVIEDIQEWARICCIDASSDENSEGISLNTHLVNIKKCLDFTDEVCLEWDRSLLTKLELCDNIIHNKLVPIKSDGRFTTWVSEVYGHTFQIITDKDFKYIRTKLSQAIHRQGLSNGVVVIDDRPIAYTIKKND